MKVEIRKTGGPVCQSCGATELVATKNGTNLEVSLAPKGNIPWYRPFKSASRAALIWNLSKVLEELRDETRKV